MGTVDKELPTLDQTKTGCATNLSSTMARGSLSGRVRGLGGCDLLIESCCYLTTTSTRTPEHQSQSPEPQLPCHVPDETLKSVHRAHPAHFRGAGPSASARLVHVSVGRRRSWGFDVISFAMVCISGWTFFATCLVSPAGGECGDARGALITLPFPAPVPPRAHDQDYALDHPGNQAKTPSVGGPSQRLMARLGTSDNPPETGKRPRHRPSAANSSRPDSIITDHSPFLPLPATKPDLLSSKPSSQTSSPPCLPPPRLHARRSPRPALFFPFELISGSNSPFPASVTGDLGFLIRQQPGTLHIIRHRPLNHSSNRAIALRISDFPETSIAVSILLFSPRLQPPTGRFTAIITPPFLPLRPLIRQRLRHSRIRTSTASCH
ncbi:hypothetical protein B0T22DRAFT_219478 [Podospora appendiculata]|uniref:Uncharacterized protein n=1 Tax=Podospora appendiculata TaxID=314037 RepID=A0AAE0X607_9PEZI|nr:hypothetical protein B0T22DRAFT_219478 [Podospora appendiculata]